MGSQALTAIIATDTDWNTSRFTIDDTTVTDHQLSLFEVRSLLKPEKLQILTLTRDQKQLEIHPKQDCHVAVENDAKRRYIRRGLNQNNGVPQNDCFILRQDGSIEGDIDWDYHTITRLEARPIDAKSLTLQGGVFTTFANQMMQPVGYNYWSRNIEITRSNTKVDGLTHYVVGETGVGHPYRGFLRARQCANITWRNCFVSGHKTYETIGAAGRPVNMGSYDLTANQVVNLHLLNCHMNHITDRTRWGVIGSNFCKNILLEDCTLSRMDTHMGVSGTYTIRRCALGHMGLNAIGRGLLTVEESTLYGNSLISFRPDYGSTWEGNLVIRNCRWIPACSDRPWLHLIQVKNDGMHDFGYPCSMPQEMTIDGLHLDDANHRDGYQGLYLFADPDDISPGNDTCIPMDKRPFPYTWCQQVTVRRLTMASGLAYQVSSNPTLQEVLTIHEQGD